MERFSNSSILRLLDANANRAREALRVMEDYARFALDDDELCGRLKEIRHELAASTQVFIQQAILCRDTPGDVGTDNKTASELSREDIGHVVTAAGKRLGEALRCLEEFAKIDHPSTAGQIEAIRYRCYDIEQVVARTLHPHGRMEQVRLCVLITESACRRPWLEVATEAILGGADCLQLREKELDGKILLRRAVEFVQMCRRHGVVSIINDRPDVMMMAGADGVHLGQEDLPAAEVRKWVGPDKIIGVSTHHIEQARQAVRDGADYIGVGPFFKSSTKPRDFIAGAEYAKQVAAEIRIPAMAIAGITAANVDQVLESGLKAVAVASAVTGRDDVRQSAAELKSRLSRAYNAAKEI
jgi:thiamine-phosphate pyrophosphorylase